MSNSQYSNAFKRHIQQFKTDYLSYSREQFTSTKVKNGLTHPGEFGALRENISKKLIEGIIPSSKKIKTKGFILNSNNDTSAEQDLIIYSDADTPVLTLESTSFFPVETVVSVGQIKSVIQTKSDLKEILNNLVKVKKVRDNMGHGSVIWRTQTIWEPNNYYKDNQYDQIFTFLICEKLNFKITASEIDALYDNGTESYLKHNLILDITNGLFGYQVPTEPFVGIPHDLGNGKLPSTINAISNAHIEHFLINAHLFISSNTIFHPDIGRYT